MAFGLANVILEAVRLANEGHVQALQQLCARHADVLQVDLVLRILLTYLPESIEPSKYVPFLRVLSGGEPGALDIEHDVDTARALPEEDALRRLHRLELLPLSAREALGGGPLDPLTCFLLDRAHRIEQETGSLPIVRQLLEPFIDHSDHLRTWMISILLPLLRLEYESYPRQNAMYTLESFEKLRGMTGVEALLPRPTQKQAGCHEAEYGRGLRGVVAPWMYGENQRKRRRISAQSRTVASSVASTNQTLDAASDPSLDGWSYVNEWLLHIAKEDFSQSVKILQDWGGPRDADYGGWNNDDAEEEWQDRQTSMQHYAQAGLAAVYITGDSTVDAYNGIASVLSRVNSIAGLGLSGLHADGLPGPSHLPSHSIPPEYLDALSSACLLQQELLHHSNPLTKPSKEALLLGANLLSSAEILNRLRYPLSLRTLFKLGVLGTAADQHSVLCKVFHQMQLHKVNGESSWMEAREYLLWLRGWGGGGGAAAGHGIFCNIDLEDLELEILKAFLTNSRMCASSSLPRTRPPCGYDADH
jgi:protein transport protein SEC39